MNDASAKLLMSTLNKMDHKKHFPSKTLTKTISLPKAEVVLESIAFKEDDYRPSDTTVSINGDVLFSISGDNIEAFETEFTELVDRYSI